MKINLETPITVDPRTGNDATLGEVFANAIFKSQGIQNAKELYDKVQGKKEADLSVKELADIQKAAEMVYVAGMVWQIDGIINGNEQHKSKKK